MIVRVNLLWNNGVNYYLCSEIQEEAWEGDFIYYDGVTVRAGQLYHVIHYTRKKEGAVYLLNDITGKIQVE